jgi:hypothetical protein
LRSVAARLGSARAEAKTYTQPSDRRRRVARHKGHAQKTIGSLATFRTEMGVLSATS